MKTNIELLDNPFDYSIIIDNTKHDQENIELQYDCENIFIFKVIQVIDFIKNNEDFINSIFISGFKGFWILLYSNEESSTFIHEDLGLRIVILNDSFIYTHERNKMSFLMDLMKLKSYPVINKKFSTYIGTDSSGLYKIGKATDILRRQNQLQVGNHYFNIILILHKDIELDLQIKYENKNKGGEWFSLTADDILDLIKIYGFKKI